MLITRKLKVPIHWIFYAQLPFTMAIAANYMAGAPFLFAMKKFIDNPAAIMVLINLEVFLTLIGGPFVNWLSDRIWTRFGRRRPFIAISDIGKCIVLPLIPFAPDLWSLIILKWIYGVMADLGTPNQPLSFEVIPNKQRGKGAGFFHMQIQAVNLVFFGTVIGRFDDVYFMGPLHDLFSLSGEHLMFLSGALLFLSVAIFTFFGFKEIKPPVRKTVEDDRKEPDEPLVKVFARGFFKDILAKSLLPLYLLLFVGQMANVGLGILGPLLYTEQWDYSLQQMGTNFALGAIIGMGVALLAGIFADATSKMKVYIIALVGGLLVKFFYVAWVYFKPDHRPELYEILIIGEVGHIFSATAGVVSFPLILEFVERNRLGTAGAGMGLFNQGIKLGMTTLMGFWVVWWSMAFFPQAGSYLSVTFADEATSAAIYEEIAATGAETSDIHLAALHRPGVDGETSRNWRIRMDDETSGTLQKRLKELENEISKWRTEQDSPLISEEERAEIKEKIAAAEKIQNHLEAMLAERAADFRASIQEWLGDDLYRGGDQIIDADMMGTQLSMTVEMIEPVTDALEAQPSRGGAFGPFLDMLDPPLNLHEEFNRAMQGFQYNVVQDEEGTFVENVRVDAAEGANAIRVEAEWEPNYGWLNRAFFEAERDLNAVQDPTAVVLGVLRGLLGRELDGLRFARVNYEPEPQRWLTIEARTAEPWTDDRVGLIEAALRDADTIEAAEVAREGQNATIRVRFGKAFPEAEALPDDAVTRRLRDLVGENEFVLRNLRLLYERLRETSAAAPVFLTVAEPFIEETYAEREYDYFFSSYTLMILTDFFGIGVIILIVVLEKRGFIQRYGVEEDADRTSA
ncbi:MAG: MFS transporter [Opitutales bacterium]